MAPLIPDEKCLIFIRENYFFSYENATGYRPRPVEPSTDDGDSFSPLILKMNNLVHLEKSEQKFLLISHFEIWNGSEKFPTTGERFLSNN